MAETRALIQIKNLNVLLKGEHILQDINLDIRRNETVAVIGPNGAGKTVLLRTILGLLPYKGTITTEPGVHIGYVPQRLTIDRDFPLTVGEFLLLRTKSHNDILTTLREIDPFKHLHNDEGEAHDMKRLLKRRVGVLSGGQFQKILIAWALLNNPDILMFDEPASSLDIEGEETLYGLLHRLQEQRGIAIILVSHDLNMVYRHAQQVFCMNRQAICFGPPQDVLNEQTLRELYGEDATPYAHRHSS